LSYNADYAPGIWNVDILSAALQHRPDFRPLLKKIADLALKLPDLITRSSSCALTFQPIPLMKQNRESSISLSQIQVACLLANAFYCTFPGRSGSNARHQQPTFPSVNFNTLFWACSSRGSGLEKVICILHYFSRVLGEDGPTTGTVTFSRRCLNNPPDFQSKGFYPESDVFAQVDFADPLIGGEFLRFGNVQEEIMCCMQPEILAGRLFLERLLSHEAALVIGAERFCNYTGYGRSFQWVGNFKEADHGSSRTDILEAPCIFALIDISKATKECVFVRRRLPINYPFALATDGGGFPTGTRSRLWSILTRLQPPERLNEDKRTAYVFEHVNEALSKPPTL
uniref:poly(ADP-ribose) glycohydrolase n=1 Tax=Schistocephalus solidus TaxID=70667 RepID=A0A183SF09_SCHSO